MASADSEVEKRRARLLISHPIGSDLRTYTVNVLEIQDLRITFKIKKSLKKSPNTAEIHVFNLSGTTRAAMKGKNDRIILQAGYVNTIEQIFVGDERLYDHSHKGPEWDTKIECGDGERAFQHGRVNESFAGGSRAGDVIGRVAKAMGIDSGNLGKHLPVLNSSKQYQHGYAARGPASRELDRAIKASGYEWSVQDGTLQVLPPTGLAPGVVAVISVETGMIESPAHGSGTHKGSPSVLKVKTMLRPSLRPGGAVLLQSIEHNGLFKILQLEHIGDTHGKDWLTELEVVPV